MIAGYTDATNLSNYLKVQQIQINNYEKQIATYSSDEYRLNAIVTPDDNTVNTVKSMISSSVTGIEGIPYQFMRSVDRRLEDTTVGRKYAEKVYSRFPLLFITPCSANFMEGFSSSDRQTITQALISNIEAPNELIEGSGKYYSVNFAYDKYYEYLNTMMRVLAIYLGIGDVQVTLNGYKDKLSSFNWYKESNDNFKTFFSGKENLVFYTDNFSSVSQSFTNDTTDSSLASQINGFADQINEIKFLFGTDGGLAGTILGMGTDITSSITSSLGSAFGALGGGVVESLASNGVNTILNGGKIIFPEIWSNSSSDEGCGSFEFKFRSPDHDTLSIYLNVLKPYCKLLCMAMSREGRSSVDNKVDPHAYTAPFLCKAYLKGKFQCDMGIISSMSVTKGAECQWNDDGLPTQIDVSIEIKNLYKNLTISNASDGNIITGAIDVVNNTAYMDFLANMAGLNVGQMEIGRKAEFWNALTSSRLGDVPSHIGLKGSNAISKLIGGLYKRLS